VRASSSATIDQGTSLTVARPPGTAEGDLLLALVSHQLGRHRSLAPPTGWTAVPNADRADGNNARIHGWYKLSGPNEPASYTFTLTGGSGQDIAGGILAVSGASSASPINASGSQRNTTLSTSVTGPSITTSTGGTLLVFGGACNATATFTPPAGMSEEFDRATAGSSSRVATEVATAGVSSPGATGTRTAAASSPCRSVAVTIAVAPAASP
jgi:MSHA biogenesis protein MshQ